MRRKVTVERNRLRFAAAHFATFRGECEPLHGHNYDVFVEVEGDLTEDAWVLDFSELKALTKEQCDRLDHKFILQRESRVLRIQEHAESWEIAFGERQRYVFPKSDVCALPIDNSTAERLAEWLAGELRRELLSRGATHLTRITVGVEEMPGQAGWFSQTLGPGAPEA